MEEQVNEMRHVTVIGAGTMGNGIAHVFAQQGFRVVLTDIRQDFIDRGMGAIAANLDRQVRKGVVTAELKQSTLAAISTTTDLTSAAASADLVIEAATENLAVKSGIFTTLDAAAPQGAILASNTSSLSITALAAVTRRPDRVIGMHFMNPVPVMKLVEVVRGLGTSDETAAAICSLCTALGKTPVEVNDYPGFVANRILLPMLNEAMYCVMEGVATPESIDTVMKLGMNHPMGPLALADLIGLDVCLSIMTVLQEGLGDAPRQRGP